MPRVKLAGDIYKDKDLAALLRRYKYGLNLTDEQIGKSIGVTGRTWSNYLKEPGKIPLGKLRAIQKQLRIPKEELFPFLM